MTTKLCLNGCFKVLPVEAFGPHTRSPDGLASRCRDCEADRVQLAKHGVTRAHKAALAEDQGGCATCGRTEPGRKGWVVDHDHRCCAGDKSCDNCRRAVLCQWCNSALGYALDDVVTLRRMADYLELGTRMGTCKSRLELEMASQLSNTDGRNGRTDEESLTGRNHLTDSYAHTRVQDSRFVAGVR